MNLEPIIQASKVIPIYVRNEEAKDVTPIYLSRGCYACDHVSVGSRFASQGLYGTVVLFGPDHEYNRWDVPLVGFTIVKSDRSFRDLSEHHWLRQIINGVFGWRAGWTNATNVFDEPILFTRLSTFFGREGIRHNHSRINLATGLEGLNDEGDDIYYSVFEPYAGRYGIYVDPVKEMYDIGAWTQPEINEYIHGAFNASDNRRVVEYYWGKQESPRLRRMNEGKDKPKESEAERDRRLIDAINQRLIEPGDGRRARQDRAIRPPDWLIGLERDR